MGAALAPNRHASAAAANPGTQPRSSEPVTEVQPPAPNAAEMQSQIRIGTALSLRAITREQADTLGTIADPIERWRKTNFLDKVIEHAQEASLNITSLVGFKRISTTMADSLNSLPLDERLKESRLLMARYGQESPLREHQDNTREARRQAPTLPSKPMTPDEASFEFVADLARRNGKPPPSQKDLMTPDGKISPEKVKTFLTNMSRHEAIEHALTDLINAKAITEQQAKEIRAKPEKVQDKIIHDLYFAAMLSGKIKHQAGQK